MKKLLALCICFAFPNVWAYTKEDVFHQGVPITWLGIDFTQMRFIGPATQMQSSGVLTDADIHNKYIPAWNDLFVYEKSKYNVAGAVNRMDVPYHTEATAKANTSIKRIFFDGEPQELTEEVIAKCIAKYDLKGVSGIGLVFFVETMNKDAQKATIWVTFIDMESKKILFAKRMEGRTGGFGFRNYWAKSFHEVLNQMQKHWGSWKREYRN